MKRCAIKAIERSRYTSRGRTRGRWGEQQPHRGSAGPSALRAASRATHRRRRRRRGSVAARSKRHARHRGSLLPHCFKTQPCLTSHTFLYPRSTTYIASIHTMPSEATHPAASIFARLGSHGGGGHTAPPDGLSPRQSIRSSFGSRRQHAASIKVCGAAARRSSSGKFSAISRLAGSWSTAKQCASYSLLPSARCLPLGCSGM